jgi:oxygen-dependent protoporphyrinogen oxidase
VSSVVIVGGGISGLTCAHRLHRRRPDLEVIVLEAAAHPGGKIRTSPIDGIVVDEAADAFLARVPTAIDLCRELGLGEQFVTPAERRAFVFRHGALHRFPEGLVLGVPTDLDALRSSGLISEAGLERAAMDLDPEAELPAGPPPGEDETVGALVRRRIGDEVFEALVNPLLSGVNAGNADDLSVQAGAAQLAAAVREQPSLITGLRRQRDAAVQAPGHDPDAPIFYGLRGGTGTLIDALVAALPAGAVRTESRVTGVNPDGRGGFTIAVASGTGASLLTAQAVVLATPSFVTSTLVHPFAPDLAADLATLAWADVALVTFAVPKASITHPLDGSGFLVSQGEGLLMTACSFGSSKWAHWNAAPGSPAAEREDVILRVSAGRHGDPRALALTDAELVDALLRDLATTIGLHGPPTEVRVSRWTQALPQYPAGHLDHARRWKEAASTIAGLHLTGASYFGLGIPACIADAEHTATQVLLGLADADEPAPPAPAAPAEPS